VGLPSIGEGTAIEEMVRARITALTAQEGGISQTVWQKRITTAGVYTPKPYSASVTIQAQGELAGKALAGQTVEYILDGGTVQQAVLNAQGNLNLSDLADGPHTLRIADGEDVLVNNYSGAGVSASYPVTAAISRLTIEAAGPETKPDTADTAAAQTSPDTGLTEDGAAAQTAAALACLLAALVVFQRRRVSK
jgi:hypothetical protein